MHVQNHVLLTNCLDTSRQTGMFHASTNKSSVVAQNWLDLSTVFYECFSKSDTRLAIE